jgi:hypothetical protein
MRRGPRLDAPGTLHHIMVRGIERTSMLGDVVDEVDLLTRLAQRWRGPSRGWRRSRSDHLMLACPKRDG